MEFEFGKREADDPYFKKVAPVTIFDFRQISRGAEFSIIQPPKYRRQTDCVGFFCFAAFVLAWVILTIYLSQEMHINRFVYGVDRCGNVCGTSNKKVASPDLECKPKDYTFFTMLMYTREPKDNMVPDVCVLPAQCHKGDDIFNRCFPHYNDSLLTKYPKIQVYLIFDAVFKNRISMIVTVALAIVLSVTIIVALYVNTRTTFLVFLGLQLSVFAGSNGFLWYTYILKRYENFVYYGSVMSAATAVFLAVLPFLLKQRRFNLIVGMYQEAAKTIMKIPLLLVLPLLTVIFLMLINALAFYTILLAFAATDEESNEFKSLPSGYFVIMAIVLVWIYAFANACQCMIVSGVIASFYFTREDKKLSKKIVCQSIWITVRYHMGSVAMGALIVTLLSVIKIVAHLVRRFIGKYPPDPIGEEGTDPGADQPGPSNVAPAHDPKDAVPASVIPSPAATLVLTYYNKCFTRCLEEPSEYLTKNAYIMTAIHGKPLYISGRRAKRLLWYFLLDRLIVDSLGYLVMHGFSFMIFVSTMIITFTIINFFHTMEITLQYILFLGYLAGTVTYFFFASLNVTAETILLCFCEDKFLADLTSTKLYMGQSLEALMISLAVLTKEREGVRTRRPTQSKTSRNNQNSRKTRARTDDSNV